MSLVFPIAKEKYERREEQNFREWVRRNLESTNNLAQNAGGGDVFVGDSGTGGEDGLVPAPVAGDGAAGKFLRADGNWGLPSGIVGSVAWGAITGTLTDQTDLDTALDGKSDTGHTHAYSSLTGIPATFAPSAHTHTYSSLTGIPATFAPSAHSHSDFVGDSGAGGTAGFVKAPAAGDAAAGKYLKSDGTWTVPPVGGGGAAWGSITGTLSAQTDLDTALAGKSSTGHTHTYSSLTSIPSTFAPSAHTHPWADVTGEPTTLAGYGIVDAAPLVHSHSNFTGDSGSGGAVGFVPAPAAGDAVAGKYLDADGTWTVPPAGGGGSVAGSNTQIQFNNSAAFGASADLTWDDTAKELTVDGNFIVKQSSTFKIPSVARGDNALVLKLEDQTTFNGGQPSHSYLTIVNNDHLAEVLIKASVDGANHAPLTLMPKGTDSLRAKWEGTPASRPSLELMNRSTGVGIDKSPQITWSHYPATPTNGMVLGGMQCLGYNSSSVLQWYLMADWIVDSVTAGNESASFQFMGNLVGGGWDQMLRIGTGLIVGTSTSFPGNGSIRYSGNLYGSGAQGDIMYHDGTKFVNLSPGTSGHFLKTQGAAANPTWAAATVAWADVTGEPTTLAGYGVTNATSLNTTMLQFVIDGGGSAITTGIKGDLYTDFSGTITSCVILADQTGSIVIDIWEDTYTNFPPLVADTITASAKPTISATNKSKDTTLTGWQKTISTDSVLRFNVDSCSTITRVTISLTVTKT